MTPEMLEQRKVYLRALTDECQDEQRVRDAIASLEGYKEVKKTAESKGKRSKAFGNPFRKALSQGVASALVQAERYEQLGGYVAGVSDEDRSSYMTRLLKKSPRLYKQYPDGNWGLRRVKPVDDAEDED